MLGFCDPSSCRTPGAALENPTNFGDTGEFAEILDGESIVGDEKGGDEKGGDEKGGDEKGGDEVGGDEVGKEGWGWDIGELD